MRLRARGLLLFSFAFSSVLASSEVVETPSRTTNGKSGLESRTSSESQTRLMMPNLDHGMEKRSPGLFPQNFSGEEGQKKESLASLRDDLEKRTRMGFTGMRGKKEYTADDYCAKNLRANIERALTLNKRYSGDLLGSKRASSTAFHGMRGKKSDDYDNEIPDEEALDFEDPLPPPREFLLDSGLFDDPARLLEDEEDMEITKRSPYAFQGMRGKKENVYDLKRAMGFLGMRGKKATEVWNDVNYKRVPQTSFFGLKGKKAQSSGFFGMRGKKSSPSAFFGIKGKQEPEMDNLEDFRFLSQFKEPESRSRFRRGISWLSNSKKAKNAFFGVRGKKSTEESLGSSFTSSYE